jgi:hypothetical protein
MPYKIKRINIQINIFFSSQDLNWYIWYMCKFTTKFKFKIQNLKWEKKIKRKEKSKTTLPGPVPVFGPLTPNHHEQPNLRSREPTGGPTPSAPIRVPYCWPVGPWGSRWSSRGPTSVVSLTRGVLPSDSFPYPCRPLRHCRSRGGGARDSDHPRARR